MSDIKQKCKELLHVHEIDIFSEIDFNVNGDIHTLSYKYIIDTYMKASEESKLVFLTALKKASESKNIGINKFFEGMGQLLLMTHLSNKIEV
ncbi:MAG: hypothetical protein A2513_05630 [Sulfurimonas sp. RIFOXYD12_FULL_33_39]|uniref:hypothetical protein n=1 Tax=unclassified Sulfurimonas TaxID=2623549 RepID=UPI0008D63630|nr:MULTISPECIES: hypothetical protein [unclassified Sulfurimonas]OHE04401.1 MAG: hypothetical protein A3G74_08595 [Sulfurimonas sp. RIFCSPLOWO2_12_FULL_34_6]OHE10350.1 MAG: hypothetical protein A2513_05630 [Sulfurimonas sp. RIFOXYD12_FULL_33_39]OHE13075.1 MAG: hypothetical protein A2530_11325 [Sulfurimonas sp. RIFOXYD2_FULL_34_21]DAB28345.1 MAG TPA: hypothetical protein CFH78_02810 [Sulfurimonas sp. UBA10385]